MSLTLFTLNRHCQDSLESCLSAMLPGDGLLLFQDGVYLLARQKPDLDHLSAKKSLFVLGEDLVARGISAKIPASYTLVDYPAFVGLTLEFSKVISW